MRCGYGTLLHADIWLQLIYNDKKRNAKIIRSTHNKVLKHILFGRHVIL